MRCPWWERAAEACFVSFMALACGHEVALPDGLPERCESTAREPASYDDDPCVDANGPVTDVGEEKTLVSLAADGGAHRLADGCTLLQIQKVHRTLVLGSGLYDATFADGGLPYASTHGGWLELLDHVELYSRGFTFEITREGCSSVQKLDIDVIYSELDHCDFTVETTRSRPHALAPAGQQHDFDLPTRWDALASSGDACQFFGLRELGTSIGNLDESVNPPAPTALDVSMDFVTAFGVQNVDLDYFNQQVIGATGQAAVGPHRIDWTLRDVGNGNTHCYTGRCLDVFDLFATETVVDATPRVPAVLAYE